MYIIHYTVYSDTIIINSVYSVHCTLYSDTIIISGEYSVHCTQYTVQCDFGMLL